MLQGNHQRDNLRVAHSCRKLDVKFLRSTVYTKTKTGTVHSNFITNTDIKPRYVERALEMLVHSKRLIFATLLYSTLRTVYVCPIQKLMSCTMDILTIIYDSELRCTTYFVSTLTHEQTPVSNVGIIVRILIFTLQSLF